ncbi:MAG: phenylalanine--tRNA ligase subunit beta, partial [Propionibacteriaceae bacterium]
MICSTTELGLGEDGDGILVLDETDDGGQPLQPGQSAYAALHLREDVLDIAVTPDRGYCWSVRGIAREAAQATGVPFTDPVDRPAPPSIEAGHPVRTESEACPLFVAVTVTGVDPQRPSPRWLQRRVQLAGMRPISLAFDITNYVMLETGQPLHAYDADRLAGPIVVRTAQPGERLTTLDDVDRELHPDDLLITDESGPIGLAGVMGGESTELRDDTAAVVIEAAHFDAMTIARTSRRHKLSSEASRRFERGADPGAAYAAAHRAADLLVELAGGTISADETVAGTVPSMSETTIGADLPTRILGTEVPTDRVIDLLQAVGATVTESGAALRITPPTWRSDLTDPYDYVEEVGRLIGYDTIEPVLPSPGAGRGLNPAQRARRAVNGAVQQSGFVEVLSFPFAAAEELDRLGLPADDVRRAQVRLANPLAETSPWLRSTLLPGLFAAVAKNTSRGLEDLALYETGRVFRPTETSGRTPRLRVDGAPSAAELAEIELGLPAQPWHLAAVLTGHWMPPGWRGPGELAGWQHAVAFVESAARALGVEVSRRAEAVTPWHPGRCARIAVAGTDELLGYAGELHPSVIEAYGLPARAGAAEIDLDRLIAAAPARGRIASLSAFPVAKEDVALVVAEAVPAAEVATALRTGAGDLCESVRLFDVYTGPQVEEGKKSLAFALRFRAPDRTLTDHEAATARDGAVSAAVEATGAVQRVD